MGPNNRGRSTAIHFCNLWKQEYSRVVENSEYEINHVSDASVFRRLMASHSNAAIRRLIKFAFSGHPSTEFLRKEGYPIRLFPSQIPKFKFILENPGMEIPFYELKLDILYSEDSRTSYLWSCIVDGDIDSLVQNSTKAYYWHLLMEKLRRQLGFVPAKVRYFYEMWKVKDTFNRTAIKKKTRRPSE